MRTYEPRPKNYDPQVSCPAKRKRVWAFSLWILKCDLAVGHDGNTHRTVVDDDTMIYWKDGPDDPGATDT